MLITPTAPPSWCSIKKTRDPGRSVSSAQAARPQHSAAAPAPTLDPNTPKFGYSPAARARCLCKPREPQVHSGGPLLSAPARPAALRRCIAGPPPRRTLRPVACCKRAPTPRFTGPSPASSASWPVELHATACCWQWDATHLGVLFSWSSFRPYSCSSRSASARFRRRVGGSGDG